MVDCRPKLISIALFWFVSFFISLSAYLLMRFAFTECALSECRRCTINGTGRIEPCNENQDQCRYIVDVVLESDQGQRNEKQADTDCFKCQGRTIEDLVQELENKEVSCMSDESGEDIRIVSSIDEPGTEFILSLSQVLLAVAICVALFFVVVIIRVFQAELVRLFPGFMITAWMNLRSTLHHPRSPSRGSAPLGPTPEAFVTPPPRITSRRRISKLIESSKLSVSEAKALREDGWTCCICLEETDYEEQNRPVTRLKCSHATHSECLRIWLETGRAACCLCNADVFSDSAKEQSLSSQGSTTSAGEAGLIGSLVVERTDRTPSSPATSVFIDISQPYSDTVPSNDERDGDIGSGA